MKLPSQISHHSRDHDFRDFMISTQSTRQVCVEYRDRLAAGSVSSEELLQMAESVAGQKLNFDRLKAIEGMSDTIVSKALPVVDPAELTPAFNTTVAALMAFVVEVNSSFPASRYLGSPVIAANGRRSLQSWTPAQTATLQTLLTAIIDSIDG